MKKLAMCLAVVMVFAGALAMAGEEGKDHAMKGKTHEVTAEVVSVDMDNGTITFKMGDEQKTAPVQKEAKAHLDKVKAGEMVVLTCMDDDEGHHEAVVKIKKAEKKS